MHKTIKILILSSMFFNFSAGLFGPLYAIFVQQIGGDILTAGSVWAVYAMTVGVLMFVFGKLGDIFNKRKIFLVGRMLNTIGVAGYLFVNNPIQLFIVQSVLGVALAMLNPAFNAIYSRSLDKGRESSEWSYWEGSVYIVVGVSALIGGIVASTFGFRMLFILMTIASIFSTIVAAFLLRKKVWNDFLRI